MVAGAVATTRDPDRGPPPSQLDRSDLLHALAALLGVRLRYLQREARAAKPPARAPAAKRASPRRKRAQPSRSGNAPVPLARIAPPVLDLMQILRFRNIDDAQMRMRPVTVFIGANNAGKTNLLQSLALLSPRCFLQFARDYAQGFGYTGFLPGHLHYIRLPSANAQPWPVSALRAIVNRRRITVWFVPHSFCLEVVWSVGETRIASCHLSSNLARIALFHGPDRRSYDGRRMRKSLTHPDVDAFFAKLHDDLFDRVRLEYHNAAGDEHALLDDLEQLLSGEKVAGFRIDDFLRSTSETFGLPALRFQPINQLPFQVFPSSRSDARRTQRIERLKTLQEAVRATLGETKRDGAAWEGRLGAAIEAAEGRGPDVQLGGALSIVDSSALAKSLGSGYRALLLLCFKVVTSNVVVIDEPEAFLHPHLQELLAEYLLERSSHQQIVVATHSNVLINALFGHHRVAMYEIEAAPSGAVRRVHGDAVGDLFDRLGVKPSQVLQANAVIWVEGRPIGSTCGAGSSSGRRAISSKVATTSA